MSAQNREKLTLLLVRKMSVLAHPLPPYPCGNTINFVKSEVFCAKTCGCPHLKNPLCSKNVRTGQTVPDCGRLLWTAPYWKVDCDLWKVWRLRSSLAGTSSIKAKSASQKYLCIRNRYRYFQNFFHRYLASFRCSNGHRYRSIFLNLVTDIIADILTKYFG